MTSFSLTPSVDSGTNTATGMTAAWSVRVADTLPAVETLWRRFETDAVASPYQRFDWVEPFAASMLGDGEVLRIVTMEEPAGQTAMVVPLVISRQHGMRVATPLGGKHANFNIPLLRPGFSPSPAESRTLLERVGRHLSVDLVLLPSPARRPPPCSTGTTTTATTRTRPSASTARTCPGTSSTKA